MKAYQGRVKFWRFRQYHHRTLGPGSLEKRYSLVGKAPRLRDVLSPNTLIDGKLLIVTPIDPTFLLLPILQAVQPTDGSAGRFRQADDIFEEAAVKLRTPGNPDDASALDRDIIRFGSLQCTKDTLKNICDVKEVTPEITVFRMSQTRVLDYLRSKATRLSAPEALEVSRSTIRDLAKDGLMEDGKEALLQSTNSFYE
ncbi:hypothetical protein C0989_010539 [Termitomyces sp. Mn162]|nr:hypothetical protein C0989_010539 [Termitomyces sp. Mn162]